MHLYDLQAEVVRNIRLTESIYQITFSHSAIADIARPGQFLMVKTGPGRDPLLRRPFSIHNVTPDGKLHILIRVVGKGTELLSRLRQGDRVQVLGPLGNCFDLAGIDQSADLVALAGGGMGVAPLLFLANKLAAKNLTGKTKIILGARNKDELLCLLAFKELGFTVNCITDDGSSGEQGFITELLLKNLEGANKAHIFCCGPTPMLKAVASLCERKSVACQVSMETFMACGISACLGCAVPSNEEGRKYVHVCKDGPVFNIREIAWTLI
jgi:dihydroorotate dehydrogenase electron transfer subunit